MDDRFLDADDAHTVRSWNPFRKWMWITVGVGFAVVAVKTRSPAALWAALPCLAWGLIAGGLGRWFLTRPFRGWVPALFGVLDVALIGVAVDVGARVLGRREPSLFVHHIYLMCAGVLFVIAAGMQSLTWLRALATALAGTAAYLIVCWRAGLIDALTPVDVLLLLSMGAMSWRLSLRQRQIIRRTKERDAFARFLPGPVVDRLSRDPTALRLGGDEQIATVLFADLRDFTAISEKVPPTQLITWLNEFFTEMVAEIFANEGILDKFLGDGLCAVFGPPLVGEDQARRAIRCALAMLKRLEALNRTRMKRGEPPLDLGIGLHTGPVIVGHIGSPLRMEYTHIGDTVNTASRIEGITKDVGEQLLVSHATMERAGLSGPMARPMAPVRVRGKTEPLQLYALSTSTTTFA